MTASVLTRLFEHNHWANLRLIGVCSELGDGRLDAPAPAGRGWTIRETLIHLVESERGYLSLLTRSAGSELRKPPAFADLHESADASGAGLVAWVRAGRREDREAPLSTSDGYRVEPWTVLVQAINHANDHRRQITAAMRALGATPPNLDGWTYGETTGAVVSSGTSSTSSP